MGHGFQYFYLLYSAHFEKEFAVTYSEEPDTIKAYHEGKKKCTRQSRNKTVLLLKNEFCFGFPDGQGKKGNAMGSQFLLHVKMARMIVHVFVFCKHAF